MRFKETLILAKSGDKEAKERLFLQYRPLLIRQAVVLGRFDEDLYQELSKTYLICIERFSLD